MVSRVAALVLLLAACKPNLNETVSLVTGPQVLAVQATPAEGAPGDAVSLAALVVDTTGPVASPAIDWSFCEDRNPLANLGPVNPVCQDESNPNLVHIGVGPMAGGMIPLIACRQFGPEVPETMGNETPGRPVDPDPTSGYYQPVSLFVSLPSGQASALYGLRISCGLAEGTSDEVSDYLGRYHANANPAVASLTADSQVLQPIGPGTAGPVNTVLGGKKVKLEVGWPTCPLTDACGDAICGADETVTSCPADCTTPQGCAGAERYVNFDLQSEALVDAREGMHVSWFATGGSFDLDRTGRDGSDLTTASDNTWTPPSSGTVYMWVVLHDDRGGVGWAGYVISVQ
jgi:hypothetical protein